MNNILHLDDIIHSNIGSAISMRPLIDSSIARYNQFAAKDIKLYSIKSGDNYVVHIMVPSEKNDEFENANSCFELSIEKNARLSGLHRKTYVGDAISEVMDLVVSKDQDDSRNQQRELDRDDIVR